MNKTLTTVLMVLAMLGSILFSTAPAFATPHESTEQTQGPTLKGTDPLSYPAPAVTPNTVNGVVPETANPTPAPEAPVTTVAPEGLANTGVSPMLYIWGAVGLLLALIGAISVVRARRKA